MSGVFDPRWAGRLAALEFRPRRAVEGTLAGRHASPRRGRSGEVVDRRPYVPGDDRRRIDWKVFARTDRWSVREEREETHLKATFLLDLSRSMAFAGPERESKARFAAGLVSAAAYVLVKRREAAGLGLFGDRLRTLLPARAGFDQFERILSLLEAAEPAGRTDFGAALSEAAARTGTRAMVVMVSDFLGPLEPLWPGLRGLRAARLEALALQVLDPVELTLDLKGSRRFEDLESGEGIRGDPETLAAAYRARMSERQRALGRGLDALGVDHFVFMTDRPVVDQLGLFLLRRASG